MQEAFQFVQAVKRSPIITLKKIVVKRNEFLMRSGMVEQNIYLVEDGALRIFFLSEFEEHTIRFGYKDSIITSLSSFFSGAPSDLYIQAIRKSTIFSISKHDFNTFIHSDPLRLKQYNVLLQALIVQQMEREVDILTYSPLERYNRVMERSPQLFQEIPAKYIASYLRMSPETLSRIRK